MKIKLALEKLFGRNGPDLTAAVLECKVVVLNQDGTEYGHTDSIRRAGKVGSPETDANYFTEVFPVIQTETQDPIQALHWPAIPKDQWEKIDPEDAFNDCVRVDPMVIDGKPGKSIRLQLVAEVRIPDAVIENSSAEEVVAAVLGRSLLDMNVSVAPIMVRKIEGSMA